MKKLFFLLLFIPSVCFGANIASLDGVADSSISSINGIAGTAINTMEGQTYNDGDATACPSGTYLFAWNGDYTADTDKACFASGASTKDGTATGGTIGATGQTGNGYRITADNQRIEWAVSSEDGIEDSAGTIWASVYITDDGTDTEIQIIESGGDANNYFRFWVTNTRTIGCLHRGNATNVTSTSTDTVTEGAWTRVGCSWSIAEGKVAVKVGAGAWRETAGTVTAQTTLPSFIRLGEYQLGGAENDQTDFDNLYVLATWEAADPL